MDDKKDVHHVSPNIDVVKHHKDSLPSWNELKYFARKYYLFLLVIALIPVALFSLGQQLANSSSAAPRLQLNSGAKVRMQGGVPTAIPTPCTAVVGKTCNSLSNNKVCVGIGTCEQDQRGENYKTWCKCIAGSDTEQWQCGFTSQSCDSSGAINKGEICGNDPNANPILKRMDCYSCYYSCVFTNSSNNYSDTVNTMPASDPKCSPLIYSDNACGPSPQNNPVPISTVEAPQATAEPPVGRGQEPTLIPAEQGGGKCTNPPGNNGEWRSCEGNVGTAGGNNDYNCVNGQWFKYPFQSKC